MYSWGDDLSDWAKPSAYRFRDATKEARAAEAARASADGPRTYANKRQPKFELLDPRRRITSESANPLMIAVDVTGSMSTWPGEIFDRLPLLYNTLSQYRPDLEVSFAAIGDAVVDRWPLQVTSFAKGFALEENLKAIHGEGGGGDEPESYGLFAHWLNTHVSVPNANRPFLIVFGDVGMHPTIPAGQIRHFLGDEFVQNVDAIAAWNRVAATWDAWFLRRPRGVPGDKIDQQWGEAIGAQKIVHIDDELRAVDYAMGLVSRSWGYFEDFKGNMSARQDESKVAILEGVLEHTKR